MRQDHYSNWWGKVFTVNQGLYSNECEIKGLYLNWWDSLYSNWWDKVFTVIHQTRSLS